MPKRIDAAEQCDASKAAAKYNARPKVIFIHYAAALII